MMNAGLGSFPDDVFLRVAAHLEIDDILTLRKTCRTLCAFTQLKHLWFEVLERDPGSHETLVKRCKPVADLSSSQLECLALHAHSIQKNLAIGCKPQISMKLDQARSVTWVHILEGRWLLAASSDTSISVLSLWALHHTGDTVHDARPITTAFLEGPVADGLVDVENGRVVIALEIRSPDQYTDILSLAIKDGLPIIVRLASLPGVSRIRTLSASRVGFALYNEVSIPCVIDWETRQVFRLQQNPDVTGGCVAMAIREDMVAVVTPKRLEVHVRDPNLSAGTMQYSQLSATALPRDFSDATVAFCDTHTSTQDGIGDDEHSSGAVRLCMASEGQLYVYDAAVPLHGELTLYNTWIYPPQWGGDRTRPHFGRSLRTLTWFDAPGHLPWRHVSFETATVPIIDLSSIVEDPSPATIYTFSDPDSPALHFMGVRDYDEGLGILVLGSACGELSVYNMTQHYPADLESCLREVPLPPLGEAERMPTAPVQAIAAAPFPYSALGPGTFGEPSPAMYEAIEARCAAERPGDVPEGWTTDGFSRDDVYWGEYVPIVGDNTAWELERSKHFLGTPIPLLFSEEAQVTIFKSGGLLFGKFGQKDTISVLQYGISASEAARAFDEGRIDDLCAGDVTDEPMCCSESYRYFILWQWEKFAFGRNRWSELKDRGGEVDSAWLREGLVFGNDSLVLGEPPRE